MTTPERSLVGTTIGSIRVLELLGEGGMGRVYRGHDERLGREVALKEVRAERRLDPRSASRFRREARILSRVEHPNICRVYELLEVAGGEILVLELVRGRRLRDAVSEGLDRDRAIEIVAQVSEALDAAHAMSVVHRDLKPENIMIDTDGQVRVLDFGLAQSFEDIEALADPDGPVDEDRRADLFEAATRTGHLVGTPRYMSPEQARGEAVTAASDLYSLGLILHELLTGRAPYPDSTPLAVLLRRAAWGDVDRVPGMPRALAALADELLDLKPDARPSASEVVRRLRAFQERPRRRMIRGAAIAAVVSLAVALAAVSVAYLRSRAALEVEAAARERSDAMHEFLSEVLRSGDPAVRGPDTLVRDVLADGAVLIDARLGDHPHTRAIAHHAIGRSYLGLGLYDEAVDHLEQARAGLVGVDDSDPDELAVCTVHLVASLWSSGRLEEAERLARSNVDFAREVMPDSSDVRWNTQVQLGMLMSRLSRPDESRSLLEEARAHLVRLVGENHESVIRLDEGLAGLHAKAQRTDLAIPLYRSLIARRERMANPRPLETLTAKANLANMLRMAGKGDDDGEAEQLLLDVVEGRRELLGNRHPATLKALWSLGVLYKRLDRPEEAEALLREVVEARRATLGPNHPDVASALSSLAPLLGREGRYAEAEQMLREAAAISEAANGPDHPYTLNCRANLVNVYEARGDLREALDLAAKIHRLAFDRLGPTHVQTIRLAGLHARMLVRNDDSDAALALVEGARASLPDDLSPDDRRIRELDEARELATGG